MLTQSFLKLLNCHLSEFIETDLKKIPKEDMENLQSNVKDIFFFCLIWTIGVTGDSIGRANFNDFLRKRLQE